MAFAVLRLLRRADGDEVLFTAITWFTHLNAIRDYLRRGLRAGRHRKVPAISALVHWDEHVIHHVVEVNAPGGDSRM